MTYMVAPFAWPRPAAEAPCWPRQPHRAASPRSTAKSAVDWGSGSRTVRAMPGYGQFCPIAQASEVLTERWTPLVIREMALTGSKRFNDIQRGVPLMSSSLLTKRLRQLERAG